MDRLPLEDYYEDIIGKAQRGLKLTDAELAARAEIKERELKAALRGKFDEAVARALALVLALHPDKLCAAGEKKWEPKLARVAGLRQFTTNYKKMAVNAYLAWDAGTKKAAAFDTGAKAKEMVEFAKKQGLSIEAIFLTHTHPDHIADLGALRKAAAEGAKVNVHVLEQLPDCDFLQDGAEYEVGALKIVAKHTHGHSRGGTSYIIEGLKRPVAVVGDALFAGSMGGGMASYRDALRTNRQHLLSLPDDAVLCPGHGPMTTVAEEKAHNPFFPEFS